MLACSKESFPSSNQLCFAGNSHVAVCVSLSVVHLTTSPKLMKSARWSKTSGTHALPNCACLPTASSLRRRLTPRFDASHAKCFNAEVLVLTVISHGWKMGPALILLFFVPFVVVRVGGSANVTVHPMNTLLTAIVSGGSAGSVLTQPFWRVFFWAIVERKGHIFSIGIGCNSVVEWWVESGWNISFGWVSVSSFICHMHESTSPAAVKYDGNNSSTVLVKDKNKFL